jgi:hypothetical protein
VELPDHAVRVNFQIGMQRRHRHHSANIWRPRAGPRGCDEGGGRRRDGARLDGAGEGWQGQGQRRRRHRVCQRLREAGYQAVQRMQAVFYCSVDCQKVHWKKNGHKVACKKAQARVAAAMASAHCGAPTQPGRGTAKGASVCIICLDVGDPPPIQSGCGCRGDAGLAHVGCRAEAAAYRQRSADVRGWSICATCDQSFTGRMALGLAEAWWGTVQDLDEASEKRQTAGTILASRLDEMGRHAESEAMARELRAVQQRMPRPDSLAVMYTAKILGDALLHQEKNTEAEVIYREVVSMMHERFGAEDPSTLGARMALGNVFTSQDKFDDAFATFQDVRAIQQRVLGAEAMETITTTANIACTLNYQGKFKECEELNRELIGVQRRVLGAEHPNTLSTRYNLCLVLYDQHKVREADAGCREVLSAYQRVLGADHPDTQSTARLLEQISESIEH